MTAHSEPGSVSSWSFRALGTYAYLATAGDLGTAVSVAAGVLADVDRTCSRFRADPDLSRANAAAGVWARMDPLLVAATAVALDAAAQTDGLVDPCLGAVMIELGYDDDFEVVRRRTTARRAPAPAARPGAWQEVRTDPRGAIFVPVGVRLDLGATAKAFAADLVALTVHERTGSAVLVSLGGDIRIAGDAVAAWPVGISEHPPGDGRVPDEVVDLAAGGLATSSTQVRRWTHAGVERHHLLDPRTGQPVSGYWRTATTTGPSGVAANVAATAALVLGPSATGWLERRQVAARLVSADGHVTRVGAWPELDPEEL